MKPRMTSAPLAAVLSLLLLSPVCAPAQTTEESQIKQYREEIRVLAAKTPPAELRETFGRNLLSLRRKLHDLLLEKRGALKKDIRDLQSPNASPELQDTVKQLQDLLENLNGEVQRLKDDMDRAPALAAATVPTAAATVPAAAATVPAAVPTPSPSPSPSPAATPPPAPTPTPEEVAAFRAAVANLSPFDLKEAAAPAEVTETKLAQPGCDANGAPVAAGGRASRYDEMICGLAADIVDPSNRRTKAILLEQDKGALLPILIAKLLKTTGEESYVSFITEAQELRTDQQIGAGPNSSGTTSLVSKGGIPYALGFAVENGAATETVSDTTVTFRINPFGAFGLLANKGFITGFRQSENDAVLKALRKTSVGLTFDTSRGNQAGVFTGDRQQLSAVSVRFEAFNERDPRHKKYEADWEQFVANEGVRLAEQTWAVTLALNNLGTATSRQSFKDPALQAWFEQTNLLVAAAGADVNAVAKVIREQADLLPVKLVTEETARALTDFARGFEAYSRAKSRLLDRIARGKVFTFEYTTKREVSAPDTSNLRLIAGTGTGRRVELTANGSLTFFHTRPTPATPTDPAPGKLRDFQFAGQMDVPFRFGDVGQFVFWFGGRYERLLENATTAAGTSVSGTKGDIAVGQFGLKVPVPGMGMHLPVSFTFANRTELVKEKEVRGNFGFTLNFDSILSRFKPF